MATHVFETVEEGKRWLATRRLIVIPTPAELRALKRARRESRAGQTITLDKYERRRGLTPRKSS